MRSVDGGENFEIVSDPDSLQFEDPSDAGGSKDFYLENVGGRYTPPGLSLRQNDRYSLKGLVQEHLEGCVIGDDDVVRKTDL